jgi:hypothetical protein
MREVEREADLESVKKEFQAINDQAKIDTSFDPVGMMREDMTKAVATSASVPEVVASDVAAPELGKSDIEKPEIALSGPEPAAAAAPADKEAEPEASAQRSAAE